MNKINEIINKLILYINIKSFESSILDFMNFEDIKPYIKLLKRGIPAHIILTLISKKEREASNLASFASALIMVPKEERRKLEKVLVYLNMTEESLSFFIRFMNVLKLRLLLMNILLAITYSIFPWLNSLKNLINSTAQSSLPLMIIPSPFLIILYAVFLSFNSIFMIMTFFERDLIKKYLPLSLLTYSIMQFFLYFITSKNLMGLNII